MHQIYKYKGGNSNINSDLQFIGGLRNYYSPEVRKPWINGSCRTTPRLKAPTLRKTPLRYSTPQPKSSSIQSQCKYLQYRSGIPKSPFSNYYSKSPTNTCHRVHRCNIYIYIYIY